MSHADLREFLSRVQSGHDAFVNNTMEKSCPPDSSGVPGIVEKVTDGKLWAVSGDRYFPCEQSVDKLPSGFYTVDMDMQTGLFFHKQPLMTDDLFELPDCASEQALAEIEKFWTLEDHYRKYGFLWKRGFLFWGPPGSGKTSTVQIVIQKIIKRGGIAVSVYRPDVAAIGFKVLRKIEPTRPLVAILEDIDAIASHRGETELLAMLDGEHQVDNVVVIATTNYPERLDPRIINRPSRFDTIYKIGMPSLEARRMYLGLKSMHLSANEREMEKWAEDTADLSIAHIKELIISVEVFGANYDETLDRLRSMAECNSDSKEFNNKLMGFLKPERAKDCCQMANR